MILTVADGLFKYSEIKIEESHGDSWPRPFMDFGADIFNNSRLASLYASKPAGPRGNSCLH